MSTQNLAQRSVHQVRCGVIQTNTGATSLINISLHRVAHFQRTRSKFTDVTNRLAVFLRIFHRKGEVSAFQFAFIANLTAVALFGEKYDERVRVLSMGDFSTELCGGTHASRTGDIGLFRIISESGTAAGVRRIEAVTGEGAIATVHADSDRLSEVAHLLKGDSNNLADKVRSVLERTRQLEKELQQLKEQAAAQESANLSSKAIDVNGVKLLVSELSGVEPKMLRTMVDDLKNQLGSTIIVLATVVEGKVSLIAGVSKDVTDRVKAGELIGMVAQQVGGKGGGRPDMAQAGGTDAAALPAALASVKGWVSAKLQ